jgi:hypothetical protein
MTLDYIMAQIRAGKTLYIFTCTHSVKIDRKTVDRFAKVGRKALVEKSDGLYVASGRRWNYLGSAERPLVALRIV